MVEQIVIWCAFLFASERKYIDSRTVVPILVSLALLSENDTTQSRQKKTTSTPDRRNLVKRAAISTVEEASD